MFDFTGLSLPISRNFKVPLRTARRGYQAVHTPTGEPPMPGAQKLPFATEASAVRSAIAGQIHTWFGLIHCLYLLKCIFVIFVDFMIFSPHFLMQSPICLLVNQHLFHWAVIVNAQGLACQWTCQEWVTVEARSRAVHLGAGCGFPETMGYYGQCFASAMSLVYTFRTG